MIDIIPIRKTSPVLYLVNKKPKLVEEIRSPKNADNVFSFRVTPDKKEIKTYYDEEKKLINIDIFISLDAELRYQYIIEKKDKDDVKEIEKLIGEKVKDEIMDFLKKTQEEYKCDVIQFAKYVRAQNKKIYEKIDWEKEYPLCKFNVEVDAKIINESLFDSNAELK